MFHCPSSFWVLLATTEAGEACYVIIGGEILLGEEEFVRGELDGKVSEALSKTEAISSQLRHAHL